MQPFLILASNEKVALRQILFFFVCSFCNIMKESYFWKGADYFA